MGNSYQDEAGRVLAANGYNSSTAQSWPKGVCEALINHGMVTEGYEPKPKKGKTPQPFNKAAAKDTEATANTVEMADALSGTISEALALGTIAIMPPRQDGSKRPYSPTWKQYQEQRPTAAEVEEWYSTGLTGFGIICGKVSDNLECLDFDDMDTYYTFRQYCDEHGIDDLLNRLHQGYVEDTPNGRHFLYRCAEISGNTKLATRPKLPEEMKDANDKTKTLIETRGEGGFIIAAPTTGTVHPSGSPYTLASGSLSTIPVITPQERRELFVIAGMCGELAEDVREQNTRRATEETQQHGGSIADDYEARTDWSEILIGWQFVRQRSDGVIELRRPGKTEGISGTIGHMGNNLFHNWSTSTEFESKSYTKFGAYAVLNHGGDRTAAARELRRLGYGSEHYDRSTGNRDFAGGDQAEDYDSLFISGDDLLRDDVSIDYLVDEFIETGTTGQIFGPSGGGKTFVELDMALSIATGTDWYGRPVKQGNVLYLIGEGHRAFKRRIRAWVQEHRSPSLSRFHMTRQAITFDKAGIHSVIQVGKRFEQRTGEPVMFIVIDTLARHIEGHENDTKDMGDFIALTDAMRNQFPGSTASIVHHTGNSEDAKMRSRGSSSLKGAMDFEIHCDKGLLTFTKMKDGPTPEPIEFKLIPVEIGTDDKGRSVTSCIVEYGERSMQNRRSSMTTMQLMGANSLVEASVTKHMKLGNKHGALSGDWREQFYLSRKAIDPDISQDTLKKSFQTLCSQFLDKKLVAQEGETFALLPEAYQEQIEEKMLAEKISQQTGYGRYTG